MNRKWLWLLPFVLVLCTISLLFPNPSQRIVHAQGTPLCWAAICPSTSCDYGPIPMTSAPGQGITNVASITIPALPSGCAKQVITTLTASIRDAGDSTCNPNFTITDGSTVKWNDYASTTSLYHPMDRISPDLPAIQASGPSNDQTGFTGIWITSSTGGTVAFNGNCSQAVEAINLIRTPLP